MNDICSHTSSNSLSSASLTLSLVSRLKQQLGMGGSMIYKQQWRERTTPSGMLFWAHTACPMARTKDRDCSGWPTPSSRDSKGGYQGGRIRNGKISTDTLDVTAQIAESNGYCAKTESAGQLNPALSRWLMGLPEAWCIAAIQSTRMPHLTPEQQG